jgi:hypothetical protein
MCQSAPIAEAPVVNEPQVFTYFPTLAIDRDTSTAIINHEATS